MDNLLIDYDAFVSITSAAPLREQVEIPDPSLMWTLTYLPTVSVPLFNTENGLPFALIRYDVITITDYLNYLMF